MWLLDLFLGGVAWFLTLMDHAPIDEDGRFSDAGESAPQPCCRCETECDDCSAVNELHVYQKNGV